MDFLGGSDGKEFACNAGDLGSIPGLGRSPGEGNGNPLQDSCREDMVDRGAWLGYNPLDHKESDTAEHTYIGILPSRAYKGTPPTLVTIPSHERCSFTGLRSGCCHDWRGSLELWGNWDMLVLTAHFLFLLGKMSRTYRFSFSILGSDGSYELFFKTIFFRAV